MTFQFDHFAAAVRAGGEISARDTLALRQWAWGDGVLSQRDAQALFELNTHAGSKDPEWVKFFTEALCDYVIDGTEPKGYVSEAQQQAYLALPIATRMAMSKASQSWNCWSNWRKRQSICPTS